jgi:hypothetical protein
VRLGQLLQALSKGSLEGTEPFGFSFCFFGERLNQFFVQ